MNSRGTTSDNLQVSFTRYERQFALEVDLEAARQRKAAWHEVARMLASAIDSVADRSESESLLFAATLATGLSSQLLKRYLALFKRMKEIAVAMKVPLDEVLSPAFNPQETAARIFRRSPDEGAEVIRGLVAGDFTLARVRELQARLTLGTYDRSPQTAVRHLRTVNAGLVERAIRRSTEQLWGAGARIGRRPRVLYLGGSAGYEVVAGNGSVAAGIDVMFPDPRLNHDYVESNVGSSLLLAPFFPEFYLAFPPGADPAAAASTVEMLKWFGHDWIGVIACESEKNLVMLRKPSGGPVPDLTGKYESFKRKYRVGRGGKSSAAGKADADGAAEDEKEGGL